ncbi:MAG: aldo/keto reductase [Gemmatimonadaceae bacterium]|nr:aldo/keto reductase [Gemmatimonadaceae bacterium]
MTDALPPIPRLIKGGWQLAGGHGAVAERAALDDMHAFAEAGITAFDCADIYTGVEALIGRFLREWRGRHGAGAPPIRVHTKCVPDLDLLPRLTRADLERTVDRSLRRLGVDRLDLVQFHWWDYGAGRMVEAARHLEAMRRAGKIAELGATNCDTAHLAAMLDAGVPIRAHQVQCSLLDRRALGAMRALCEPRGIPLLAYGSLAGGFLHERWLGAPAPAEPLENRSLVKYRLIIEEWGGWDALQSLLRALHAVAARHATTIGAVAVRWTLDQPGVGAVIVGARNLHHLAPTRAALGLALTAADRAELEAALPAGCGPAGDVYALEREPGGRHAVIMRYGLNAAAPD